MKSVLTLVPVAATATSVVAQVPPATPGPVDTDATHGHRPAGIRDGGRGPVSDRETRSTWNAYGLALDRPLKSTQLKQVILVPRFWFACSQFPLGDQNLHRT